MRPSMTRGALVLVGGQSRGVGKTLFIEQWLRARCSEHWVAIKVSAHRHAPDDVQIPLIEEMVEASPGTAQTARYLCAGATRAFLVRSPAAALPRVAAFVEWLRDRAANVIVESNRLARFVRPDAAFFLADPEVSDWKPSSADCLALAHVVVCSHRKGPHHDSYFVTSAVGDGAGLGAHSLHRDWISRAPAP